MYSVGDYGRMIADEGRIGAYAEALRRAVRPGSAVADLGAGTGIMTLLACRFGARRVYALEPDDVIQVAREVVTANAYADRVEFHQRPSTQVELPERVDVIVSDLRGVLPPYLHHLTAIQDARTRLLAPGGVLIPLRDTLWAAPVEAPEVYATHVAAARPEGFDFRFDPARRLASNSWRRVRLAPQHLLAEPGCWAVLDYTRLDSPDVAGRVRWNVARAGTVHGLLLWFDTLLAEGVGFSNAPAAPERIYGCGFFPLLEPVALDAGDSVEAALCADLVGADYVWRWHTRIFAAAQPAPRAEFRQSTLHGLPLSPQQLRRQGASHVPELAEEGEVDLFILERLRDRVPLGQIAAQVAARYPRRFASVPQALTRVGELSLRYTR